MDPRVPHQTCKRSVAYCFLSSSLIMEVGLEYWAFPVDCYTILEAGRHGTRSTPANHEQQHRARVLDPPPGLTLGDPWAFHKRMAKQVLSTDASRILVLAELDKLLVCRKLAVMMPSVIAPKKQPTENQKAQHQRKNNQQQQTNNKQTTTNKLRRSSDEALALPKKQKKNTRQQKIQNQCKTTNNIKKNKQ